MSRDDEPKGLPMFAPNTPMMLTDVTFTTEEIDDETHRVVDCTFKLAPFSGAQAEALHIRSLLFDSKGLPKDAIETIVAHIGMPDQRVTFAMAPDQGEHRVVLMNVAIGDKLRAKVKRDREPFSVEAAIHIRFAYPTAEQLLYLANGVNDTHYLTFEPEQGDLLTSDDDDAATVSHRPTAH